MKKNLLIAVTTFFITVGSVSVQAGQCVQWKEAKTIHIYKNSDPWCYIDGKWNSYRVAEFFIKDGKLNQRCCVKWRD